jgi:uncharacterized protein YndB with AHSA1/START domain
MQTQHITTYKTHINAPVDKVWEALTSPEIVKQYFFGSNLNTDWRVGSPITFSGTYEGQTYEDKGTVLEYEENRRLAYSYLSSWSKMEDRPENYLRIAYEVAPADGGTDLTITQSNYDEERAKHSEGNWAGVINGLRKLVE